MLVATNSGQLHSTFVKQSIFFLKADFKQRQYEVSLFPE